MDKNLLENLKSLRQIQPDSDYTARSRFLILAELAITKNIAEKSPIHLSARNGFAAQIHKPIFAMGLLISFFVLIVVGSLYQAIKPNQNDLIIRANEANSSIQVKLNEIKYLIESGRGLETENVDDIQVLLEKTTNELKEASALSQNEKDLEKSLEKIVSAKESLIQINSMIK